ncbi:MAG TPA: glycosyl hydrolase family 8 [bacterium]|nr:glycosyl hydrolase family 8 [bacterium]
MKTFKSKFNLAAFLAFVLIASLGQAQNVNSGAGSYTFPHNTTYAHGYMATGLPSTTASNGVSTTYRDWYSHAVISSGVTRSGFPTCSSCLRVYRNTNGNDTVSEGIGYGMLIAVMMDDKTLFDGLYKYAYQWMPDSSNNMVMDWQLNSSGNIIGANGATDADEDMAMAFLIASKIWPSAPAVALTNSQQTSVSRTYAQTYEDMVTAIWTQETKGGSVVNSGDAFATPYYTSYMTPAWYNCWASSDTFGRAWGNVTNWAYNTYFTGLYNNSNDKQGFFPDTATAGFTNNVSTMGYDASRYPMRIGLDYLWNGSAGAVSFAGTFATNVMNAVNGGAGFNGEVGDTWSVPGGSPGGSFCDSLQIGPLAVAAMITNQANATSAYNQLIARYGSPGCNGGAENFQYFQDTLCMLCELITTGNFPNIVCGTPPCGSLTCTPTPSPTPLPCYMVSDDVDGTEENHTNGFWFSYEYASVSNTPITTPVLVGVSNTNYILQANGPNSMPYADAVTGYCAINGGSTVVYYAGKLQPETVYAGYALGTELKPGYQNLNSMTNISFWVQATKAPVTLQISFYNPAIDVPAGGNANQYKNTAPIIVNTANTWQYVSIASGIANIAPSSYAPATGVSGGTTQSFTYSMAMSQVTSLQWQEVAPAAGTTYGFSVGQVCIAGTGWVTPTPLPTSTPVVTILPTDTPTLTPTKTLTPTITPTLTKTITPTLTQTQTPTQTTTKTVTPTQTQTPTQTLALTATPTGTPTQTLTVTATKTQTPAFTPTASGTPTNTKTPTLTATVTLTPTVSSTPTTTFTPTLTLTPPPTNTPTPTSTVTLTPTVSDTPTITLTPQFSFTPTFTFTVTNTFTPTATLTATNTPTTTFTPAFTSTVTSTLTKTLTPSATPTVTATLTTTPTPLITFTPTPTLTLTQTPVPTNTLTPTVTPTPVPGVSFGSPQFSGSLEPGTSITYSQPVTITTSTATNVSYGASLPTGLNFTGFTSTAGGSASGATLTWPSLGPGIYNIDFTANIDPTATGYLATTSSFSFTGGGPLVQSSGITVVVLTPTPTQTPIVSVPVTDPIPYPNPSTGNGPVSVSVSFGQPTGPVHLQIFTTAFRMVQDINEGPVNAGAQSFSLNLVDKDSIPLANGLYYVVISTPNGRSIGKILVLR